MYNDESLYWIWLADKCGTASADIAHIIEQYETPFDIYRLDDVEIGAMTGIKERLKNALCDKSLEKPYSIMKYCKKSGVGILTYSSPQYPSRLKMLEDPPAVLYYRGKLPDFDARLCIAVVGTRKMSEYGRQSAYRISYELASANAVIVSGMALGIDGTAAGAAIAAGGCTVAVLGCGIDIVYPREHEKLMRTIEKSGAVITEYPPSELPAPHNFPKRNRIISGLCQGTFVVEGARRSGSLITAARAVAQGREVFALPANIDENNSEGPNELIKNGAYVALSADDIISHYDFLYHDVIDYRGLNRAKTFSVPDEKKLAKLGVSSGSGRTKKFDAPQNNGPADTAEACTVEKGKPAKTLPPDNSEEILGSLDSTTQSVFRSMPVDKAVSPDSVDVPDLSVSNIVTSLTILELNGLVTSLPGGLYIRK